MDLGELIDLEQLLREDSSLPDGELIERDRELAKRVAISDQPRASILSAWVRHRRPQVSEPLYGQAIKQGLRQADSLITFLFLLVGVVVTFGVLRFQGDHPINILVVLGVLVIAQLAALSVSLIALLVARLSRTLFMRLPLVALFRSLIARIWAATQRRIDPSNESRNLAAWLQSRRSLYSSLEHFALFNMLQRAAISFNLGVIATWLLQVAFTDLAFGWSTTLRVGPEELHRFCEILSTPWSSLVPNASPSLALIESTQYFRLEGAYRGAAVGARSVDAAMVGAWWQFLLLAIVVYGLFPRIASLILGSALERRAKRTLSLNTPYIERLLRRLSVGGVKRARQQDPGNTSPLGRGHDPVSTVGAFSPNTVVLCTRWREAEFSEESLATLLASQYNASAGGDLGECGGHDYAADLAFVEQVKSNPDAHLFVVAEPWTAPDRAFRRFVQSIRKAGGRERTINVLLTEGGQDADVAVWSGYLAELADPYLALDASQRVAS